MIKRTSTMNGRRQGPSVCRNGTVDAGMSHGIFTCLPNGHYSVIALGKRDAIPLLYAIIIASFCCCHCCSSLICYSFNVFFYLIRKTDLSAYHLVFFIPNNSIQTYSTAERFDALHTDSLFECGCRLEKI